MEVEQGISIQGSGNEVSDPATGSVASQSGVSDPQDYSLLFKAGYSVVLDNILQYLNLHDTKTLSSISKEALHAVRKSKRFSGRVHFRIVGKTMGSGVLKNCCYPWKHLFIRIELWDGVVLETITSLPFLESAESLRLFVRDANLERTDLVKQFLLKLLGRTKSLRELALESITLKYLLEEEMTPFPELKQLMSNLRGLEVVHYAGDWDYDAESMSLQFSGLKKLVTFICWKESFNKVVLKILEQSKDTMEELELGAAKWTGYGWSLIKCRKLRVASLPRIRVECTTEVEKFLGNQPPLEEIKVGTDSPSRLLNYLRGKTSKLRKLDIEVLESNTSQESSTAIVDWRILETMKKLEDLHLWLGNRGCGRSAVTDAENILGGVPTSNLKKVHVEGVWKIASCFSPNVAKYISRFKNVSDLCLENLASLDDAGLQEIIKGCPNLRILTLENLRKVKGYGISGVLGGTKVGASLTDLKDLTSLYITACDNIELDSILAAVRLKSLRSFGLWQNRVRQWLIASDEIVFQILEQNPNLTKLWFMTNTPRIGDEPDSDLETRVKKLYPRIRLLQIEHANDGSDEEDDEDNFTGNNTEDSDVDGVDAN